MPLHEEGSLISLGEGNTPCLHLERTGAGLGLRRLYAKVEYANPTGSFKDRGTAVMLSMVREMGFSEAVDDSSGNAGASLGAYASRGGMGAAVFVPAGASPFKISQIGFYGADVRPVEGPREGVTSAAREYVAERGAFYATHNWSPYFIQGMKSFAYEAVQDVPIAIDHVVVPAGNGSLVVGPARGFAELVQEGTVPRMPRFHAVQSRSCMPVVAAWRGQPWTVNDLRPTVAGGIAVSTPPRGAQTVETVRSTGGSAVAVEEESIVRWQRAMARDEGLFMEPTSAAAFAGLESLVEQGVVGPEDAVLVPVTGFGLKDRVPGA
jgi:threonine synthase